MAETTAKKLEVRKLNNQDFWAMLQILRKGGKAAFARMQEADNADDDMSRGMVLFDVGMEYAEAELIKLFSGLAGMTPEEFKEGDFDLTLTIIEQLEEQNDLANFMKRVAALAGKFSQKREKSAI